MKCGEAKKLMEERFGAGTFRSTPAIEEHLKGCADCRRYLGRLDALRGLLDSERFEVRPGELDSITFESIAGEKQGADIISIRKPRRFFWIAAPIAAAAIIVLALVKQRSTQAPVSDGGSYAMTYYEIVDQIASSDSIGTEVITGLASGNEDYELVEDELLKNSDIDDMLGVLSESEMETLLDRIEELKG